MRAGWRGAVFSSEVFIALFSQYVAASLALGSAYRCRVSVAVTCSVLSVTIIGYGFRRASDYTQFRRGRPNGSASVLGGVSPTQAPAPHPSAFRSEPVV